MNSLYTVNDLKKLENVEREPGQNFSVVGYFLVPLKELVSDDADDLSTPRGMWINLGSYSSYKQANKRREAVIKQTDVSSIWIQEMYEWQYISNGNIPKNVKNNAKDINLDKEELILEQTRRERIKIQEEREKMDKMRKDIDNDIEKEMNKGSIEYYTRQWWLASKDKSYYEIVKREMNKYEKLYRDKLDKIKELDIEYPEYKNKWKDVLKPKLMARNEENLYNLIDKASTEMSKEILYD
uniref:Uncharacterized protein n=1 Tax=Pithovirus LCPAC101 TaxID=2506586 RepID=A0A481Z264_9VIRU|nr:MAG: uncharacterized protein LCPAC101_00790 [Pithovirus LCPAC101]